MTSLFFRTGRQPPLWGRRSSTAVRFISPVRESLLAQVGVRSHSVMFVSDFRCRVFSRFFLYLGCFLVRYVEPSSSMDAGPSQPHEELELQFPSALLEELFGLTLLTGRLKDLPANVQSALVIQNPGKVPLKIHSAWRADKRRAFSSQNQLTGLFSPPYTLPFSWICFRWLQTMFLPQIFPPSWHLLHLHLDIHWSVLEILHILGHKMQGTSRSRQVRQEMRTKHCVMWLLWMVCWIGVSETISRAGGVRPPVCKSDRREPDWYQSVWRPPVQSALWPHRSGHGQIQQGGWFIAPTITWSICGISCWVFF